MNFSSNKVSDIFVSFRKHLADEYPVREIDSMLHILLEEYADLSKMDVMTNGSCTVNESVLIKLHVSIQKLKSNYPLQYIIGKAFFMDENFLVSPDVLIPRPETAELVNLIVDDNKNRETDFSVLDIGTGSGCIAVMVDKYLKNSRLFAIDCDEKALSIARENALTLESDVDFKLYDILQWENNKMNKYDIVVSNPPYVRNSEKQLMQSNVLKYEPAKALYVDDDNPLLFYDVISDFAIEHLNKNGRLYFEINEYLSEELHSLMIKKAYSSVEIHEDIHGKKRMLSASLL